MITWFIMIQHVLKILAVLMEKINVSNVKLKNKNLFVIVKLILILLCIVQHVKINMLEVNVKY